MELIENIEKRKAVIGILGLGYVGIPPALSVSRAGFKIIGFGVLEERISQMSQCVSRIQHISDVDIHRMLDSGFEATLDFTRARGCDVLIICVPTPLNTYREPELSYVEATLKSIAPYFRKGQLLSLESTT